MKRNDLIKLREKTKEELKGLAEVKKLEFMKVEANIKAKREKNLKKAKILRHELSQVLTILRERELMDEENSTSRKIKDKSAKSTSKSV